MVITHSNLGPIYVTEIYIKAIYNTLFLLFVNDPFIIISNKSLSSCFLIVILFRILFIVDHVV